MDFNKRKDVIINLFASGNISDILEVSDDDIDDIGFEIPKRVFQYNRQNESGDSSDNDIQPRATLGGLNDKSPFGCRTASSCCGTKTTAMNTWMAQVHQRRTLRSQTIFGNRKPLKNDEKCVSFHLKAPFIFKIFKILS